MSIASIIFRHITWHFKGEEKRIYLTFDDGPTPDITQWVLSVLKDYNAKASFFCLGKNVEKYPEICSQIIKQGHSVGNHSYSHLNGWLCKNKKYFKDIEQADTIIKSKLFRPPYGKIKPSQIKYLKEKYKIVIWDVLSKDYDSSISPKKCYQRVVKLTKNGSVIVFHDTNKAQINLQYTLPGILKYYDELGFEFCAI
ncbi:MAG: polysaccharide deacetylase family protein [Bacteroidales bacterium]|jgi:peptidoglycan/xylan/chitin deacetylase (PgdA/CDA1 family)|nr:polysaccharide deacetylase family protein [Bacteroidales bacterium]